MDCGSPAAALARPALLAVERSSGFAYAQFDSVEAADFGAARESGFLHPAAGLSDLKAAAGLPLSKAPAALSNAASKMKALGSVGGAFATTISV